MKRLIPFVCISLAWAIPPHAFAQPADGEPEPSELAAPDPGRGAVPSEEALRIRAAQIRALIEGELDPEVDAQSLFTVDLSDPEVQGMVEPMLRGLETGTQSAPAVEPSETDESDALAQARAELFQAQLDFLSLPSEQREQLLAAHEARRHVLAAEAEAEEAKRRRLAELRTQAEQLEAFLEGKLDPSVALGPLLRIDLSAPDEVALDSDRRQRFVSGEPPAELAAEDAQLLELDEQLSAAAQDLDSLRRRFLELDEEARAKLVAEHLEGDTEADTAAETERLEAEAEARRAAEERERALEDAAQARTEARRLIANQRVELLSVQEAQARYAAELASQRGELEDVLDSALRWKRRVQELEQSGLPPAEMRKEAELLYSELVPELTAAREALRRSLGSMAEAGKPVPQPPELDDVQLPSDVDDSSLRELQAELSDRAAELRLAERKLGQEQASALRDAVVMMNRSRLQLFDELSRSRRNALSGFGDEGVAQAKRELDQISLEARYHLQSLPGELSDLSERLRSSPGSVLGTVVQLLLLILFFRWWRKRADPFLEKMQRTWLQKRPQTELSRAVAGFVWYLRRVRKPLEWLIFFSLVFELIGRQIGTFSELSYLRIVILWVLLGAFVVQLIDAIADRQGYFSEHASKLRFRSLRMVGITVVVVGLILSIANAMVGKGALYAWVINSCWFLAIPLFVVLVYWWADSIFERAALQESSAVLRWVREQKDGILKYPAASVGGVYLLAEGIYGFFINKAKELTLGRTLLAYLSRRQVERQASGPGKESTGDSISEELCATLCADTSESTELVTAYMSSQVHATRAFVRSDNAAIIAVVGEHGEGKTTFLTRVVNDMDEAQRHRVQCPLDGLDGLKAQLASAIGLPEDSETPQIREALNEQAPTVIVIDDAHRLIKPRIGGLKDMDGLIRLMRGSHPSTSWLLGLGLPAWQYLRRARGQSTSFDQLIELEPWEERQIGKLIEQRTSTAGIAPSFESLNVPQQFASSRLSGEERTRQDFYRILTEYSGGNAAVALLFWCESLNSRPPDGEIQVRIPKVPSASELEDRPNALYFVLRTILQLERARMADIVRCTDLEPIEVADALRLGTVLGCIEERDRLYEVSLRWYPAVTGILRRKHLMLL